MLSQLSFLSICLVVVHSLPPDKIRNFHIIKTRSIDLNNAHGLAMETRLTKVAEPTGYNITLRPYLEQGIFTGVAIINVTWLQDGADIPLHRSLDLQVLRTYARIFGEGNSVEELPMITMVENKKPWITVRLKKIIPKGTKGQFEFEFSNRMEASTTEAFFKTTYKEQEVERIVVATQLRPNNARRMFPCFDEPAYKTPFELSVVRPRKMVALSNTKVARIEDFPDEPDAVLVHFERTPPMSTFTLGLVIAELQPLINTTETYTDKNNNHIELQIWARPEFLEPLKGLNDKLRRTLNEVADFWKVTLPLKKLDLVALPNYMGVKPADNWGLIVFRESDLTNQGYLQLAQELSYQWLGALTTPAWWSDAHINKALVGYLAAETAFKINNGSEMEGKWPMTVLYSLYYEFSKRYPHSRITGMKQETACTKIELLFRMFNYTLGADTFKKGVRNFIQIKKYKTFNGEDIWEALYDAALQDGKVPIDIDVRTIAKSWIEKDRLPFITVEKDSKTSSLSIAQRVYLRERPHDVPDADKMVWWLPLVVVRGDKLDFTNSTPLIWTTEKNIKLTELLVDVPFYIINPEEIAPYPVNYDEENWHSLSNYLQGPNRTQIPELTRAKLLHDAWNLAYAGELSAEIALNMTLFLKNERHHLVWDPVFTMIDHLGRRICGCMHDKFQAYIRRLLTPLYKELVEKESENEESSQKNLRAITKTFLCKAGYKPCVEEAQKQYSKWMEAPNPDEGNPISNQYICPVFKWGTKDEWEFGLQRVIHFPHTRKQSERTYLLKTLAGCPVSKYKINRLLNVTILESNGNFTDTDIFLIFSMLTGSPQGYTILFEFLEKNWSVLKEKFAGKTNLWDSLITSATSQFISEDGLAMVSNLYVAHQGEFGSAEHIIEKSMKNIREEAKWSVINLVTINSWIEWYLGCEEEIE